jgi:hypothetical protein
VKSREDTENRETWELQRQWNEKMWKAVNNLANLSFFILTLLGVIVMILLKIGAR